jgi:hypothetical protein
MKTPTPWSEAFFEKLMAVHLVKKLSALYRNRTVFTVLKNHKVPKSDESSPSSHTI